MNVFQNENEIKRLNSQEELLQKAQDEILNKYLSEKDDLVVLDVGSNDGFKTRRRFDKTNIKKVIGIEYSLELVKTAKIKNEDSKFSFYCLNVEDDYFGIDINRVMIKDGIKGFDIIHVSLVLLHLMNPALFLKKLRNLLNDGGKLIIIEADDNKARISGDKHYLKEYNKILKIDPLMGKRDIGKHLPVWINETGYKSYKYYYAENISLDKEIRKEMFNVYFLAVIDDFAFLCDRDKENKEYLKANKWLKENLPKIRELILKEGVSFGFGVGIFVVDK